MMPLEVRMAQRKLDGIQGIKACAGEKLGTTDWFELTQDRVTGFADATLDHQWIHVDPERARAESPFGGPIAHGYLTLSLLPHMLAQIIHVDGVSAVINYGLNRLRFPAPVPVGARIRYTLAMADVRDVAGGVQCQLDCAVEVEGSAKPALVAEILFRYYE
jgi:acyl dehydratase